MSGFNIRIRRSMLIKVAILIGVWASISVLTALVWGEALDTAATIRQDGAIVAVSFFTLLGVVLGGMVTRMILR